MLNHVNLMGRLTRDPELRYTQANTPVASFTLAVERDLKNASGEYVTDFIDCVAWSHTGEFVSKHFFKGNMMAVSGRLQIRDWTDRDNNKRRSAEVVVDNVYFCESAKGKTVSAQKAFETGKQAQSGFAELEGDGELPF